MTQPTQAQIEAAAKAMSEKRPVTYTQMAIVALTAATQAQIEAAANAMREIEPGWVKAEHYMPMAEAALTAAAQVGEQERMQRDKYFSHNHVFKNDHCIHCGIAESDWNKMFAAVQVGEPLKDAAIGVADEALKTAMLLIETRAKLKTIEAATIERCAQVADSYSTSIRNGYDTAISIAAAIRKLKDE